MIALLASWLLMAATADVTGKWQLTATAPNGTEYKMELTLTEDAGKLGGTLSSERGALNLDEAVLAGDDLTMKFTIGSGQVSLKLAVANKQLKGTFATADGTTGQVAGVRPDAASGGGAAGAWKFTAKGPNDSSVAGRFEFKQAEGRWTGVLHTDSNQSVGMDDLRVEGSTVSFAITAPQGTYKVKLAVEGSVLKGSYSHPDGGAFEITGSR